MLSFLRRNIFCLRLESPLESVLCQCAPLQVQPPAEVHLNLPFPTDVFSDITNVTASEELENVITFPNWIRSPNYVFLFNFQGKAPSLEAGNNETETKWLHLPTWGPKHRTNIQMTLAPHTVSPSFCLCKAEP